MSPIQQMLLGVGAVATKTYVDDVFNTYLYKGTSVSNGGPAQTINNGIDVSGTGGLVWIKTRSAAYSNALFDTVRGKTKRIKTNSSDAEDTDTAYLADFKTNGFEVGTSASTNNSDQTFASWTFRKAKGFFDVVTYTGNGVDGRSISHSLGCIPGMWMVKRTDGTGSWIVGHSRMLGGTGDDYKYHMYLNTSDDKDVNGEFTYNSPPTTTTLSLGSSSAVNGDGNSYVCYLFAGGESTAATARSVDFDGSEDYLLIGSSSDFTMGTGDFTVEGWIKYDAISHKGVFQITDESDGFQSSNHNDSIALGLSGSATGATWRIYGGGGSGTVTSAAQSIVAPNQWYHFAYVRSSGVTKLYINGTEVLSKTDTHNYNGTYLNIGGYYDQSSYTFDGKLSNFRVVKGTAVYTSAFRPPTEPLTNITNTKLLCCNNSSTTGSTVTPGTITVTGSLTASTDSPFDDPAGFKFGENEDQGIIKCGSYVGNGNDNGPEIHLGFEPQWLLFKSATSSQSWIILDCIRNAGSGAPGEDAYLLPNSNSSESGYDAISYSATGFKLVNSSSSTNENGETFVYMALRRPDVYCGKPPELGTGVFAMTTGTSNTPAFSSGFITDLTINRQPASAEDWYIQSRLTTSKYLVTNDTDAEANDSNGKWDYNNGWYGSSINSNYQAWMWKRHAGFDVVTITDYDSTTGPTYTWHPHSLGKKPEMIWVKRRDSSQEWWVYHHGANGGTNPWNNYLQLHSNAAEGTLTGFFGESGPTATAFSLKRGAMTDGDFIFMLFASVEGISKVGSYTGNASNSGPTITLGFAPRFIMLKGTTGGTDWFVLDTTRGLDSGDDERLALNDTSAQDTGDVIDPSSTGFQVVTGWDQFNGNNQTFIYYAHA